MQGFYASNSFQIQESANRLISDQKLKQQMGQAAAQLVRSKFQAQREFDAHAALYRQILAGTGVKAMGKGIDCRGGLQPPREATAGRPYKLTMVIMDLERRS